MLHTIITNFDALNKKIPISVPEIRQEYHNVAYIYSGSGKALSILVQTPDEKKQTLGYLFVMYQENWEGVRLLNEMEKCGDIIEFVGKTVLSYSTPQQIVQTDILLCAPIPQGCAYVSSTIQANINIPPMLTEYETSYLVFLVFDGTSRFLEGDHHELY